MTTPSFRSPELTMDTGPTSPVVGRGESGPHGRRLGRVPRWKRALDLGVGTLALIAMSPLMLVAGGLVFATSWGPILFRQTRVGRGEQPFTMFKFRTMQVCDNFDANDREVYLRELRGEATPEPGSNLFRPADDRKVTAVGRFLRRYSIDELPQLLNVIKGDMSLVGPRPGLPWEVDLFTEHQRRRHETLPGITGLWQVSGRNRWSSREMLEFDIQYVDRCSLKLDLIILFRTPQAVLLDRYTR